MSSLHNIHNRRRRRQAVIAPLLHHRAPALDGRFTTVGPLGGISDDMGQGSLGKFAGHIAFVPAPIPKS